LRVVHVINGLTTGGAETVLCRLATFPSDVTHEVICLERRGVYSDRLEARGIRVHHLDWTSAEASPRASLRLRRLIKQSGADVVQAWMYRSNILGGIAAKTAGIPVVWNIRSSTVAPLRPATRFLARVGGILARWIPSRIVNCSAQSVEIHAKLGYDPRKVVVIPNGYPAEDIRPDEESRNRTRSELGIGQDVFLIGNVGRWHRQKGYPVLIQALASLLAKGLPVRLILVGPELDSSNAALAEFIDRYGCAAAVTLLGASGEMIDIARALDLHVLASIGAEGFPNVVAETMLSGTPNVATSVGDTTLILGDTGWIVPPSDSERLAAAIEGAHAEWSSSPAKWRRRQAAARRRIGENFSLEGMVARYEEVWNEVAAGASTQAFAGNIQADEDTASKPLRVLHIINRLTLGGAEALLYRLASHDPLNEHVIVSLGGPAWYSERLEARGVAVHHLGVETAGSLPGGVLRLRRLIRDSGVDVVQCWMYHSNLIGGLIAKSAGKPVVWGIHNSSLEAVKLTSRVVVYLGGMLARWTPDFVINCSTRSAELHSRLGYAAGQGTVVHNGYDPSVWFPDEGVRISVRHALKIDPREFVIGNIARWHPQKDIPNLLAALAIVRRQGVRFRCVLIGAGLDDRNEDLVQALDAAGGGDGLLLLGSRSDVQDLARAIDLNVLASCGGEAFPNVVAETMLSGTPNVVTDVGDAAAMIGATGWIVPPRHPDALAAAIVKAYREWNDRPDEWELRRDAARARIADNFSFARMLKAYQDVWLRVATRKRVKVA
jgi:glycosyltransferase involved in cell wall biosynthesis